MNGLDVLFVSLAFVTIALYICCAPERRP